MSGGGRLVMPTRILIVGGGGREHALAWKLASEPGVNEVFVAPGQRRHRGRAAGATPSPTSIRSTARRSVGRRAARRGRARRHRAGGAAGGRRGRRSRGGRHRGLRAERGRRPDRDRARRSATRSPSAAGVPMARAGTFERGRAGSGVRARPRRRRAGASWSRRTGWPAGKGVTVCDTSDEAARRDRLSPCAAGLGRRRGAPRRRGGERHRRCATAATRSPCPSPATTSAWPTATGPEHGRDGRVQPAAGPARTPPPTTSSTASTGRSSPSWPAAAPRSVARCTPA